MEASGGIEPGSGAKNRAARRGGSPTHGNQAIVIDADAVHWKQGAKPVFERNNFLGPIGASHAGRDGMETFWRQTRLGEGRLSGVVHGGHGPGHAVKKMTSACAHPFAQDVAVVVGKNCGGLCATPLNCPTIHWALSPTAVLLSSRR